MTTIRYDQSNFTQGEIDPRLYARTDTDIYYKALKKARNIMVIPQGGAQARWGTTFVAQAQTNNPTGEELAILTIGIGEYLIEFSASQFFVYLGNLLLQGAVATPYAAEDIPFLRFTQINGRLIITNPNFAPRQIVSSYSGPFAITGFAANTLARAAVFTRGSVVAVTFQTTTSMPAPVGSAKRLYAGRTYYARVFTGVGATFAVYDTPEAAQANLLDGISNYTFSSAGVGASVNFLFNFAISQINFKNMPTYDFDDGYDAITFTPSAVSGNLTALVTVTASAPIFTAEHVGGIFEGNSGVVRITNVDSNVSIRGYTVHDFFNTNGITGALAFLEVPVWSAVRGYPRACSFFQNRLVLGNTASLPNGVWLSVTGEVFNFDDSEKLPDNAISYYPASGDSSNVLSFTSARSLVVHTDTANYSTPTFTEIGVTPENFVLLEQNKDGVYDIQPVFIDNQIIYVDDSGSNVKNMVWDVGQSAYVLNNISVKAAHLIKTPVDMAVFSNPRFFNGALVLFINSDGTLTMLQTLSQEGIGAYSSADTQVTNSLGETTQSRFLKVVSSGNRVWFLVERTIGGIVPTTNIRIEELDFTVKSDGCHKNIFLNATALITGLSDMNGSVVDVTINGLIIPGMSVSLIGTIILPQPYTGLATIGFPFTSTISPLPIANIPGTNSNLYSPTHIRGFYVNYFNTIGATIQGNLISTQTLGGPTLLDQPPIPASGISLYTMMEGWDQDTYDIEISQALPLPMTIIGISYVLEI